MSKRKGGGGSDSDELISLQLQFKLQSSNSPELLHGCNEIGYSDDIYGNY